MRNIILAFFVIAIASACAPTPESIKPSPVTDEPYQSWSCEQLQQEQARLTSALDAASTQQRKARSDDTTGVILLGLPVGSMSGKNVAPQIARYKGELAAVQKTISDKHCQ